MRRYAPVQNVQDVQIVQAPSLVLARHAGEESLSRFAPLQYVALLPFKTFHSFNRPAEYGRQFHRAPFKSSSGFESLNHPSNGLNGAQRLNGLNDLNEFLFLYRPHVPEVYTRHGS
jgi:hypothetical protein